MPNNRLDAVMRCVARIASFVRVPITLVGEEGNGVDQHDHVPEPSIAKDTDVLEV